MKKTKIWKDPMVEDAFMLLIQGKVIEETADENASMGFRYDVDDKTVRIFKKHGRRLITCTCVNGTRFANEPTLCKHKLACLLEYIKLAR